MTGEFTGSAFMFLNVDIWGSCYEVDALNNNCTCFSSHIVTQECNQGVRHSTTQPPLFFL